MYECKTCKKTFTTKYRLERHLNKKLPCTRNKLECYKCKKIFSCQQSLSVHRKKCNGAKEEEKPILNDEERISMLEDMVLKQKKEIDNLKHAPNSKVCDYCGKVFSHSTHKHRHMRESCKVKQLREAEKLRRDYDQGYIRDIKLREYGEENMEWVRKNIMEIANSLNYLNIPDSTNCKITSMKYIHANEHTLENKNVRIPNKKDYFDKGLLQVWKGNKWITKTKTEVIDISTKKLVETLEDQAYEELTPPMKNIITTYEEDDSFFDNKYIRKRLESQIYCLLKKMN